MVTKNGIVTAADYDESTIYGPYCIGFAPPPETDPISDPKNTTRNYDGHYCELESLPVRMWGEAIDECYEDYQGRFWVHNDEYKSQVNFCPLCGAKAPQQVPK